MRFDVHLEVLERTFGLMKSGHRDDGVLAAMDQQHRRPGADLVFQLRRPGEHSGIADDTSDGGFATEPDMKCHHGALAESNYSEVGLAEPVLIELSVNERVDRWRG